VTKRLFNPDLDNGVVCDPRVIYLDLELSVTQGLLYLNLEFVEVSIRGLLFFNLVLLKW